MNEDLNDVIDINELKNKFDSKKILFILLIFCLFFVAFSSYYVVDQKEEAVVLRLGKFNRITEPGLHFKLPFGIEQNYNIPTKRVFKEEFGFRTVKAGVRTRYSTGDYSSESIMLTGDLNIVDVKWVIQFKIVNPRLWLFEVAHTRKTIRDISQSVINQLVGDRTIFDVIGNERAYIESKSEELINEHFKKYKLGATITTVKLQNIVPPKGQVQDAFEDVNKAIQDRNRLINEGKEAYNRAIPKARGEAERVIQEAEGYAIEKINKAKGDIARFLAVYGEYVKNPSITKMRLYYDMFGKVFGDTKNIDLIDKDLKNFLPIKSLETKRGGK